MKIGRPPADLPPLVLRHCYIELEWSCRKIAEVFGVSDQTILTRLHMLGVPVRSHSESGVIANRRRVRNYKPTLEDAIAAVYAGQRYDGIVYKRAEEAA